MDRICLLQVPIIAYRVKNQQYHRLYPVIQMSQ